MTIYFRNTKFCPKRNTETSKNQECYKQYFLHKITFCIYLLYKKGHLSTSFLKIIIENISMLKLCLMFCVAIFTINFLTVDRFERNLSLATAIRTNYIILFSFCSLVVTSVFSAFGTSFRFIYESFFSIKFLLTCREHKLASAIFADEFFVLVHSIFSLGCNKPHRTTLIRCILYFNPYFEIWQPQNFSWLNLIYK